jgi:hypothetical protein
MERTAPCRHRIELYLRYLRRQVEAAYAARCARQIAADEAELDENEAAKWGPRWA